MIQKTKISQEDIQYLMQIDDAIQEMANQLMGIELMKQRLLDDIKNYQIKRQEFMEQLAVKHKVPAEGVFEIDPDTGEIIDTIEKK